MHIYINASKKSRSAKSNKCTHRTKRETTERSDSTDNKTSKSDIIKNVTRKQKLGREKDCHTVRQCVLAGKIRKKDGVA